MALDFPASSASPFTAPNGVVYTWNADGYWEAKADFNSTPGPGPGPTSYVEKAGDNMTGDLTLGTDKITLDATDGTAEFTEKITVENKGSDATLWIQCRDTTGVGNSGVLNFGFNEGDGAIKYIDKSNNFMAFDVGGREIVRMQSHDPSSPSGDMRMGVGRTLMEAMFCVDDSAHFAYENNFTPHIKLEKVDIAGAITGKITTDDLESGTASFEGLTTHEGGVEIKNTVTNKSTELTTTTTGNFNINSDATLAEGGSVRIDVASDATSSLTFEGSRSGGSGFTAGEIVAFSGQSSTELSWLRFATTNLGSGATEKYAYLADLYSGNDVFGTAEKTDLAIGAVPIDSSGELTDIETLAPIYLSSDGLGKFTNGIAVSGGSVAGVTPGGMLYSPTHDFIALTARNYDSDNNPADDGANSIPVIRLSDKRDYNDNRFRCGGDLSIESQAGGISITSPTLVNIKPSTTFTVSGTSTSSNQQLHQQIAAAPFANQTVAVAYYYGRVQDTVFDEADTTTWLEQYNLFNVGVSYSGTGSQNPNIKSKTGIRLGPSLGQNTWQGTGTGTNYGVLSQLTITAGVDNYNFYAVGNAPNYFEGIVEANSGVITSSVTSSAGALVFQTGGSNGNYGFKTTNGSTQGNLRFNSLTTTRNFIFPDVAGTIALTSDLLPFSNGVFSVAMQADDPGAFTATTTTNEEGVETTTSVYNGTREDLLDIIKDLRARVTALEAAAT